jgi:hypothetical protein
VRLTVAACRRRRDYVLAAVAAIGGVLALLMIESQPPVAREALVEDQVELKAA